MEFQHSERSNLYENAQQILPQLDEAVVLPDHEFTEVININEIAIVPPVDPLDASISDGLHNNQKSFKLSASELTSFQDKTVSISQLDVLNTEGKKLDTTSTKKQQKPSNATLKKFCSDITAQKLSVMQGLIRKEYNDKANSEQVSNYITAIEQPSIGINSCFICGMILSDSNERYMYLDHQRLLGVKLTLLQFLSEILCQKVLTNSPEINLCQRCSDLINEADSISKQLRKIKNEIENYFNGNKRPKLKYQIIPHFSNIISKAKKEMDENSEKAELSLRELALTRPRHRKKLKNLDKNIKTGNSTKKKTLGRPRKPFQCPICKLKFISNLLLHRHGIKEHMAKNENNFRQINVPSINADVSTTNHIAIPDTEVIDENCTQNKIDKLLSLNKNLASMPETTLFHRLPEQRCSSLPPMPMRPIQPKPQTLYQVNSDGSLAFLMGPVANETTAALVTVTPSYINLNKHFYSCDLCAKKFLDENSFKMHKIAAHGIRKKKSAEQKCDANNDRISKVFECTLCDSVFGNKALLFQHINAVHFTDHSSEQKSKQYKCDDCSKLFSFKYEMENHKEVHSPCNKTDNYEFVCRECKIRLSSKAALKIHLYQFHKSGHADNKEYLCAKCGYLSHTRRTFMDHAKNHRNGKLSNMKMQCPLCKKKMLASSFKIHMIRMHSEPKHVCDLCGKKFPIKSDLARHNNAIHLNVRQHDCGGCRRKFFTHDSLRYHVKKAHAKNTFYCDICDTCFKLKEQLQMHNDEYHKTLCECPLCPRFYTDDLELKFHLANTHKIYKEVGSDQDDPSLSSNGESAEKEQVSPSERELNMENYRSQVLISSDKLVNNLAMSAAESGIEIVNDTSAQLCAIKLYPEPVEESIVLTSLHDSNTFQNDSNSQLQSSFTALTENRTHLETVFTDGKHCNDQIDSQFTEGLENVDSIYVVRQYDDAR